MADYEYYKKHYAFRTIPEESFEGVIERARAVLDKFKSIYAVKENRFVEQLVLYEMAEEINRDDISRGIERRTVGAVGIYYQSPTPLEQRLFHIAASYLQIYRGVGS